MHSWLTCNLRLRPNWPWPVMPALVSQGLESKVCPTTHSKPFMCTYMAGKVALQVKVLATKPDDQSLIAGTHRVEGENWVLQVLPWPPYSHHDTDTLLHSNTCMCLHALTHIHTLKYKVYICVCVCVKEKLKKINILDLFPAFHISIWGLPFIHPFVSLFTYLPSYMWLAINPMALITLIKRSATEAIL